MIDYEDALEIILKETPVPLGVERIPVEAAEGRVLAEDVFSDVNLPPFDKSAMDGFAVKSADIAKVPATLEVVMDIPAGEVPSRAIESGQAASVMTGAPVPEGADAVVQVEWTSGFGSQTVTFNRAIPVGKNISPKAEIMGSGAKVLSVGTRLGVEELSLLAAVGADPVTLFKIPTVAVLSTGDELVPPSATPRPGQIRDANGPALMGFLRELGLSPVFLGQVGDDPEALRAAVKSGLAHDCLLLSGGVSAGAYDYVQDILIEHGVTLHTTRVAVKPGKPTVFGTHDEGMVFGLPGNPVSVMVIARVFAAPALRKWMGFARTGSKIIGAKLENDIKKKPDRLWFVHGKLNLGKDATVKPIENRGSADLRAAVKGDCLIVTPKGESLIEAGRELDVIVWTRCL